MATPPTVSVVVATKNRKGELREALRSLLGQTVPHEVIVLDDGSTDGTSELVRSEFPHARLHRSEQSEGYIAQRNRGAQMASAPIVVSIDDDCILPHPRTFEQTLRDFDHPRVGVVAIPYIDMKYSPEIRGASPDRGRLWALAAFRGCAHAIRRDLFLHLHGYHATLFRQTEELDLSIRMLDAGYIVRIGHADPIHHLESPVRSHASICAYTARGTLLYAWWNVPLAHLPVHWLGAHWNLVRFGIRTGNTLPILKGIGWGYGATFKEFAQRAPVRGATYRLYRKMVRRDGIVPLDQIEAELPPIRPL
jgi:glycosyltransferase involved in cell wall biosynthesis